jgi:hypothetical protein
MFQCKLLQCLCKTSCLIEACTQLEEGALSLTLDTCQLLYYRSQLLRERERGESGESGERERARMVSPWPSQANIIKACNSLRVVQSPTKKKAPLKRGGCCAKKSTIHIYIFFKKSTNIIYLFYTYKASTQATEWALCKKQKSDRPVRDHVTGSRLFGCPQVPHKEHFVVANREQDALLQAHLYMLYVHVYVV